MDLRTTIEVDMEPRLCAIVSAMPNLDIPTDLHARTAWVIYQLKLRGSSLSAIGRRLDCSRQAVRKALLHPSYRQELAIARTLEVSVQDLFPERYEDSGKRRHRIVDAKGIRRAARDNGKDGGAS